MHCTTDNIYQYSSNVGDMLRAIASVPQNIIKNFVLIKSNTGTKKIQSVCESYCTVAVNKK